MDESVTTNVKWLNICNRRLLLACSSFCMSEGCSSETSQWQHCGKQIAAHSGGIRSGRSRHGSWHGSSEIVGRVVVVIGSNQ